MSPQPTGTTKVYSGPRSVGAGSDDLFEALAYKSGMVDSVVTNFDANNQNGGKQARFLPGQQTLTTTVFSVWDGDWAILEEYGPNNVLNQSYVQGLHGLVKTLPNNIYYYQDELGSTSHIASATGQLLESYLYNLYGAPTYWNAAGGQLSASAYNVRDLFTGQRFVTEIGLYDDRNRFMSPDLGRFLQPDPIGFRGDSSNLYRYCGNDWANRSDPMGTDGDSVRSGNQQLLSGPNAITPPGNQGGASLTIEQMQLRFEVHAPTAMSVERAGGNTPSSLAGDASPHDHAVPPSSMAGGDSPHCHGAPPTGIPQVSGPPGSFFGGQANRAAGLAAEGKAQSDLVAGGNTILGSQVAARTSGGLRVIDHLAQAPSGQVFAVEVKSGGAVRNASQLSKDALMAGEGAVLTGKNAPASLRGQTVAIPTIEMRY